MPHGYVYVRPAHFNLKWVGVITYAYFAGSFYHCSFYCNGFSYDLEGGMSNGVAPAFLLYKLNYCHTGVNGCEASDFHSATSAH